MLSRWYIVMLICCHAGMLSCWYVVTLVCCCHTAWYVVTLVCCHAGMLSRWYVVTTEYCLSSNIHRLYILKHPYCFLSAGAIRLHGWVTQPVLVLRFADVQKRRNRQISSHLGGISGVSVHTSETLHVSMFTSQAFQGQKCSETLHVSMFTPVRYCMVNVHTSETFHKNT